MSIESEPNHTDIIRNANGTFAKGTIPGPGRPKGSSMKEYVRRKFYQMTDEEKEQWLLDNKVTADTIWRMGEGNPKQDTSIDITENEPDAIKLDE